VAAAIRVLADRRDRGSPTSASTKAVRYIVAFASILVAALLAGALVAWPLGSVIRKSGLGFVDRFLGAIFGVARGALLVVGFALVAGLTSLPRLGLVAECRACPGAGCGGVRRRVVAAPGMGAKA
jgi:membrane protein required for colicin V production